MPIDVLMPQLSPTMTEGRLANWLKNEGDAVSAGDVIAEVETDKATMEVEATEDGIIHAIMGKPGEDIQVGVAIAVLKAEGETVAKDYKPTSQVAAVEEETEESTDTDAPKKKSSGKSVSADAVAGLAPVPAGPVVNAAAPAQKASAAKGKGHVNASPLARRIAEEKGVDLSQLKGTGPNGRVTAEDIEVQPNLGGGRTITRRKDEVKKLNPMRKSIAQRLTGSKQYVPHFYLTADVEMDALMDVRQQLNTHGAGQFKLSVNDFILKACAMGLAKHPAANAAWNEDSVVTFGNVDISVAVSIEGGLITPIVFNADQKGIVQISREMKDLAAQARSGELKPEQYEGGSFSLSNLGMYGVKQFNAIINPPQAAILACGAAKKQVVVQADGSTKVASVMTMTMSVDHRVIDGALGAELLGSVQSFLENPATLVL